MSFFFFFFKGRLHSFYITDKAISLAVFIVTCPLVVILILDSSFRSEWRQVWAFVKRRVRGLSTAPLSGCVSNLMQLVSLLFCLVSSSVCLVGQKIGSGKRYKTVSLIKYWCVTSSHKKRKQKNMKWWHDSLPRSGCHEKASALKKNVKEHFIRYARSILYDIETEQINW